MTIYEIIAYFCYKKSSISMIHPRLITPDTVTNERYAAMAHDILAIDDIMLFPVKKEESASFFNLVNSLHEKTSVIITTNKAPTEWVQTLNDEVLATAIIDRLLYRCEVIKLAGTSYRLENRKTIFSSDPTVIGKQQRRAASRTIQTQE